MNNYNTIIQKENKLKHVENLGLKDILAANYFELRNKQIIKEVEQKKGVLEEWRVGGFVRLVEQAEPPKPFFLRSTLSNEMVFRNSRKLKLSYGLINWQKHGNNHPPDY